jgi:hypothetical protein
MTAQPLPALTSGDPSAWDQALYAFLVEKGNRSGSKRTVESYSRMLWPFFAERSMTPDRVKPADVLAWVHGIGRSGRTPSSTTIGARIACLSSFYRFLIRMGLVVSNPTDAVERPRAVQSVARGYSADEVRRLLAVVPDAVACRRDRAILLALWLADVSAEVALAPASPEASPTPMGAARSPRVAGPRSPRQSYQTRLSRTLEANSATASTLRDWLRQDASARGSRPVWSN